MKALPSSRSPILSTQVHEWAATAPARHAELAVSHARFLTDTLGTYNGASRCLLDHDLDDVLIRQLVLQPHSLRVMLR